MPAVEVVKERHVQILSMTTLTVVTLTVRVTLTVAVVNVKVWVRPVQRHKPLIIHRRNGHSPQYASASVLMPLMITPTSHDHHSPIDQDGGTWGRGG